jgi:acyl-CoA thioesterase-1
MSLGGGPLPKVTTALQARAPLRIVALGSSSTWGTGASSRAHTYPARLEQELRVFWPDNDVRVFNAGIGGQLARHMLARIDQDVTPRQAQLVIWQTGVNDAIRGVPLDEFRQQLVSGIARLRAGGSDVILIDQQFYPSFKKLKDGPMYMTVMREVAAQNHVPVMKRFRIMQHLISSAQFTEATLLAKDQFHLNDRAYDCLGRLLAQQLRSAALPPATVPAAKTTAIPAVAVPIPPSVADKKLISAPEGQVGM